MPEHREQEKSRNEHFSVPEFSAKAPPKYAKPTYKTLFLPQHTRRLNPQYLSYSISISTITISHIILTLYSTTLLSIIRTSQPLFRCPVAFYNPPAYPTKLQFSQQPWCNDPHTTFDVDCL